MEGYFPVEQYCRLTGVSKDTAHHRAIRGTVESFKEKKSGRWFIYYCDEAEEIPEGFIHCSDYAKKYDVHYTTIWTRAKQGLFDPEDIRWIPCMTKQGRHMISLYIKQDAEYPNTPKIRNRKQIQAVMDELRPKGYLTVHEFAIRERCSKHYVYNRIFSNKIKGKKVKGHWYVHENVSVKGLVKNLASET